jgi:hypothetical protein
MAKPTNTTSPPCQLSRNLQAELARVDAIFDPVIADALRRLDRLRDDDVPSARLDPRPLAAYRLGLGPREFRKWQRRLCGTLDCELDGSRMLLALDHLDKSLSHLAPEIRGNAYPALRACLADVRAIGEMLVEQAWARRNDCDQAAAEEHARTLERLRPGDKIPPPPPRTFFPLPVDGRAEWTLLRDLADSALADEFGLQLLAALGAALGDYDLQLQQHRDGEPWPSWAPVVEIAKVLPEQYVCQMPFLERLRRVPPEAVDQGVAGAAARRAADGQERVKTGTWLGRLVRLFAEEVEAGLAGVCRSRGAAHTEPERADDGPGRKSLFLGLDLDQDRPEVRRKGYRDVVKFGGNKRLWNLFMRLYLRADASSSEDDLRRTVWQDKAEVEIGTIEGAVSDLRRLIRPLGLCIPQAKKAGGYRLEDKRGQQTVR